MPLKLAVIAGIAVIAAGCNPSGSECGPTSGVVANIVDGDTIDLESGERIRYLMVDTPESTNGATDCFGQNAKTFNRDLVLDKEVTLAYDVECTDRFGRLLAYVSVGDTEVNSLLVDRGYACVLHIGPNGDDRVDEFEALEDAAKADDRGMWGLCKDVTCD